MKRKKGLSDDDFLGRKHQADLENGEVIELGSSASMSGAAFEAMRTRLSHGEVLAKTLDTFMQNEVKLDGIKSSFPQEVSTEGFDSDVDRIKKLTPNEIEEFDEQLCRARGEERAEGGGVYVRRTVGFGSETFGFAMEAESLRWMMTNEFGLHAHCAENLRREIIHSMEDAQEDVDYHHRFEIISGLIFQIPFLKTPLMCPFGYQGISDDLAKKMFEEIWSWKKFIPIGQSEMEHRVYRYGQLFTFEHFIAEKASFSW